MKNRTDSLKEAYNLIEHPEGGCFSEAYTSPFEKDNRTYGGSIYFMLEKDDLSHFHQIDCDELWFFHEGCGMKVVVLDDEGKHELLLGSNYDKNERDMVLIKAGSIFAAENLDKNSYTFISCVTIPGFTYEGFRLVDKKEIKDKYPDLYDDIEYMAFEEV